MSGITNAASNDIVAERARMHGRMIDQLNPVKRPADYVPITMVAHALTQRGLELVVNRPPIGDMAKAMKSMLEKFDNDGDCTVTVTVHDDDGRHYFLAVFS